MKASIKFREDRPPLVRAKVPVGVLGLPFLAGASTAAGGRGDDEAARDLRLDLATAFPAGPSLRLSYRPNDPRNPFSLVLKIGVGPFGSPSAGSPLAMSAEFGLLGSRPTFSLLLKPRFGDFAFMKSVPAAGASPAMAVKVAPVRDGHGIKAPIVEIRPNSGMHAGWKFSGFPVDVSAFAGGGRGGIDSLLSGFEVSARSVLPLHNRTAVQFKWGLRVPPELRTAFDDPTAGISLCKLPLLVMNKISIERLTDDRKKPKEKEPAATTQAKDSFLSVRQDVEALQVESGLLRRAVEELQAELAQAASPVAWKRDRQSNGKSSEITGKSEGMNKELMKPLTASTAGAAI